MFYSYGRVELKTSDHRPVRAFFQLRALKLHPLKCEKVYYDVISYVYNFRYYFLKSLNSYCNTVIFVQQIYTV